MSDVKSKGSGAGDNHEEDDHEGLEIPAWASSAIVTIFIAFIFSGSMIFIFVLVLRPFDFKEGYETVYMFLTSAEVLTSHNNIEDLIEALWQ
ncbi:unnamed protein product [Clavelina lepadiformis]|uniref:Uncharacterized protein n=1 Tax=Clavelina lepadiformis TaxID=159417 RepID=A0ABP0GVH0_CLALP